MGGDFRSRNSAKTMQDKKNVPNKKYLNLSYFSIFTNIVNRIDYLLEKLL